MTERAVARIDVGAVERNCTRLPKPLCAVVKADAYGHGVGPVTEAALAGGATWLAVATAAEAAELRRLAADVPILVMGALTRDELQVAVDAGADVVAWSEEVAEAAPRVHVKLDTGMGRLGTRDRELALRLAARPNTVGLMTHFATADELDDDLFHRAVGRVPALRRRGRPRRPAGARGEQRGGAARAGLAFRHGALRRGDLRPRSRSSRSRTRMASSRRSRCTPGWRRCGAIEPGQSVGYGRRWRAKEPTWVATVPVGYGDGWRRALTNDCDVLIRGRRHPLVGTISMDNVTVALGAEPSRTWATRWF